MSSPAERAPRPAPHDQPAALVVGAGPGVSGSLARLLAREGYAVALVGREPDVLADLGRAGRRAGSPDAPPAR